MPRHSKGTTDHDGDGRMGGSKPAPKRNTHSVAVHIGDRRKIEPGEEIPADVTGDTLKALLATGFFK